MTRAKQEH